MRHNIINHSLGFTNINGEHTNDIESFWAHLKSTMRKECGVKRENIELWLEEYTFKRRFLKNISAEDFKEIFINILKIFFN